MDRLLAIIEENGRISIEELAVLLDCEVIEVANKLDEYEREGYIKGYRAMINHDKLDGGRVQALIELKVAPKKDVGFDDVARKISELPEVDGVQLISGGFDLLITLSGKSFHEIASFVSRRLSPIDSVLSTATHFILNTYKKDGVIYADLEKDERGWNL